MKVLILGGNGFIGSHYIDKLLINGHDVRVFDIAKERFRPHQNNVEYIYADFNNRKLLCKSLDKIDVVVHLVSTTTPSSSNSDPKYDVTTNLVETIFLLEQCVENGIKKVVFMSSGGAVYGNPRNNPASELSELNPISSYGITKLAIEKYLFMFKKLYDLDYVILRPSNPYGPRQSPYGNQGIIPIFLEKIFTGRPIEIWGSGEISRDYIYIDDLISALYNVTFQKMKASVYNIGSGVGCSILKLIDVIEVVTGTKASKAHKPRRPEDVQEITLDISRAIEDLRWRPKVSLSEGVESTLSFIRGLYEIKK